MGLELNDKYIADKIGCWLFLPDTFGLHNIDSSAIDSARRSLLAGPAAPEVTARVELFAGRIISLNRAECILVERGLVDGLFYKRTFDLNIQIFTKNEMVFRSHYKINGKLFEFEMRKLL